MRDYSSFREFIQKKGAAELLIRMEEYEPAPYTRLEKHMFASSKTVSDRLDTAKELGYIQPSGTHRPEDHGNVTRYELTPDGRRLKRALESLDFLEKLQQLKELEEEIDDVIGEVCEWESRFMKERGDDETKENVKTIVELGFPGDHTYPNPLAFYFDDKSVDPDDTNWYWHEDTDDAYNPFKKKNTDEDEGEAEDVDEDEDEGEGEDVD